MRQQLNSECPRIMASPDFCHRGQTVCHRNIFRVACFADYHIFLHQLLHGPQCKGSSRFPHLFVAVGALHGSNRLRNIHGMLSCHGCNCVPFSLHLCLVICSEYILFRHCRYFIYIRAAALRKSHRKANSRCQMPKRSHPS
jgi:hypothetical protein